MKKINDLRRKLKDAIPNNGIGDSCKELKDNLFDSSALYEEVLLLENRFNRNDNNFDKGIISKEDHEVECTRVTSAMLHLIDDIKEKDLKVSGSLIFNIRSPRLKVDMFQCDQVEARERFEEKFRQLRNIDSQHYLILAERHQQPRRFIEHLVFELEDRSIKLDYQSIGEENIRIMPLDRGSNLDSSKAFFKQDFGQRFQIKNLEHLSDLQRRPSATEKYNFTVAAFECMEWRPHTKDLLYWLINDFCQPPPPLPTHFLFFYIFDKHLLNWSIGTTIRDLFSSGKSTRRDVQKTLDKLDALPTCTLIPELKPVPVRELINWLHDFISNEEHIDRLLKEVFGVAPESADKQLLNMSFIENRLMNVV